MRSFVVTGTSSGIGQAVARQLIGLGYRVFGMDVDGQGAATFEAEIGDLFVPLPADITDPQAVSRAAEFVRKELDEEVLCGLVNCAGVLIYGPLFDAAPADVRRQFEVDVMGTYTMMTAFAPLLGYRLPVPMAPGRIVNVSALSARVSTPFFAAYGAANAAIEAMSKNLRSELKVLGIDVVVVRSGIVRTGLMTDAKTYVDCAEASPLRNAFLRFSHLYREHLGLSTGPERVAAKIVRVLMMTDPKPLYTVARRPVGDWLFPLFAPMALIDRLMVDNLKDR
tara:strand:- start:17655 stop:18497 length:843 start_codon:yes stop_codon:yes gene_type:complete